MKDRVVYPVTSVNGMEYLLYKKWRPQPGNRTITRPNSWRHEHVEYKTSANRSRGRRHAAAVYCDAFGGAFPAMPTEHAHSRAGRAVHAAPPAVRVKLSSGL